MGSQQPIKSEDLAYIAGFLDGDGSIMVQVKNRKDTPRGWRLMFTICLYQDSLHSEPLLWMRERLGVGYMSNRTDHITELRINGYKAVQQILLQLQPFVKFKKKQTDIALRILSKVKGENISNLSRDIRLEIAEDIICLREENYRSHKRRYSSESLKSLLGFA